MLKLYLSHPPERIPDRLAGLDGDCDMVVGSRYVPGASTDEKWTSAHGNGGIRCVCHAA